MLIEEAQWFAEQLAALPPSECYPMCNMGSSTEAFRTLDQPWIDQYLFAPARNAGHMVKHLDMKAAPGVDLVGDMNDPEFKKVVCQMKFKSVLSSNMLEHVVDREDICRTMLSIVPVGGMLFVSAPQSYPYHPDPIDTMFRPTLAELTGLFPGTTLVKTTVAGKQTLLDVRRGNPILYASTFVRFLMPFYKPVSWWKNKGYLPWFSRPLTTTCVILRKVSE